MAPRARAWWRPSKPPCAHGPKRPPGRRSARPQPPPPDVVYQGVMISGALVFAIALSVPPEFRECMKHLRVEAKDAGIRGNTFDRAMKGVEPDQSVLDAMQSQPE